MTVCAKQNKNPPNEQYFRSLWKKEKISKKKYAMEVNVEKDKKKIFIIMNFIFIYYANIFRKEILHPVFITHFTSKF